MWGRRIVDAIAGECHALAKVVIGEFNRQSSAIGQEFTDQRVLAEHRAAGLHVRLDEIDAKLDTVLEKLSRAENASKVVRSALRPVPAPVTGLPGAAPKAGGVDRALQVLGDSAAPHARGAIEVVPRVPPIDLDAKLEGAGAIVVPNRVLAERHGLNRVELVEALRNGRIKGAVKRPGRQGGWSAPDAAVREWAAKQSQPSVG